MWQASEPGRVLAVDFGGTKVAVTTGDGSAVLSDEFDRGAAPGEVLQLAVELGGRLDAAAPEVVSIATPGSIVDGHALFAPNVSGWDGVDLSSWGRDAFGCHVIVTNDVEAAATGEALAGALLGIDIGMYVNIGTGIAAAVVAHGRVLQGAHRLGGEIGYGRVGPADRIDWGSRAAPLEMLAGGVGFREAGINIPFEATLDWLDAPEGSACRTALDELARHLLTCVLLIDPAVVVLGGGLARVPVVLAGLRRRLTQAALAPVELVLSAHGPHASVRGALALASLEKNQETP